MFVLDEKIFKAGLKFFQIPLSWFVSVSKFLNNLVGGGGIKVDRPTTPGPDSPVEVYIDEDWLNEKVKRAIVPTADSTNVDNTQTGDAQQGFDTNGIAASTAAYVSGDSISQAAGRITKLGTGVGSWTAGGTNGHKQFEISRIAPFAMTTGANPTRYAKIFSRLVTRNHNGQVVSIGDEVDQNLIIRLY